MEYLIYIGIVAGSVLQSMCVKFYNKTEGDALVYNVIKALSALLLFGVIAVWQFSFHVPTLLFACCYGLSLSLSMYVGYKALAQGPLALTCMIISFSVILPVSYGIGFCKEPFSLLTALGLTALVVAIVFTNVGKKEKRERVNYGKWFFYVFLTFLCDGVCAILQKQHQINYPESYTREFMLFAMLTCSVLYLIMGCWKVKKETFLATKGKKFAFFAGITNATANFLTIVLAGFENASVLFPTISVGTILATLLCGTLIFREKLRLNHYIAILSGIAAIVLLKL